MNFLKNGLFLLLAFTVLGLSSCGDDECTAPDASENIVGSWDTLLTNGEVTFNADGTYIDDDGSLLAIGTSSADDTRTYSVSADGTTLTLDVTAADGSGSVASDFTITQNECDEIKLEVLGITETLTRK